MTARLRSVLVALAVAPLAAASLSAQTPNRYLGPNWPALVSAGQPVPGSSATATPSGGGGSATLVTPWDCSTGSPSQYYSFSNMTGGKYQTVSRMTSAARQQAVTVTGTAAGNATDFSYRESLGSLVICDGSVRLVDTNGDGAYDTVEGSRAGGGLSFNLGLVLSTDGNYISIPWSQAAALGVKSNYGCGTAASPQVWVPLADTNGDGKPDSVVLDLNGDGVADPELFRSPPLAAAPAAAANAAVIPTLTQWGLVALSASLALAGWLFLRQRGLGLGF